MGFLGFAANATLPSRSRTGQQRSVARFLLLAGLGLGAATVAALSASASPSATDSGEWIGVGGSAGEPHFGNAAQIDTRSVNRLGLAWSLDLPGEATLEATPLQVGGTLYFTGSQATVYAVDAVSGKLKWKYDPESGRERPYHLRYIFPVNRGVAYADGKIFVGTRDGRLIAISAADGKPVWSVKTVDDGSYRTITGAPRIAGDKVVIGNGGGDLGERGYVTAYRISDGQQAWRFFTVPGNPADGFEQPAMEMAAKTWTGEWWKISGGGGTVWDSMVYDPESHLLYLGVGNSGPYNPRMRNPGGGDNLFLTSIVAVNADTGQYVWHYQMNPNEAWDYKAAANMILASIKVGGVDRKVIMQAPTNGFFYVLDRQTGELLSAEKLGKVTWAERIDLKTGRPVEVPGIRYENGPVTIWPGILGMHNWQPMSFSPTTGLVFIPVINAGTTYGNIDSMVKSPPQRTATAPIVLGTSLALLKSDGGDEGTGGVLAWDPVAQKQVWRVRYPHGWNGGTLATAGNLVFAGDGEGILHAYDAKTGAELWNFNARHGIVGAPMTYTISGRQYISILVGYGGAGLASEIVSHGWKYNAQPRRLLTFALDARRKLPPTAPRDLAVHALDVPGLAIDYKQAAAGAAVYGMNCVACHGLGLRSHGMAPDLRESAITADREALGALLNQGGLEHAGMPRFAEISAGQVDQLYLYVRAKAREALGKGPAVDDVALSGN